MKNKIINTLFVILISLVPFIANLWFTVGLKYFGSDHGQMIDKFTYSIDIYYKYPNIPANAKINLAAIKGAPKLANLNKLVEFKDLNINDIPEEMRGSIETGESFSVNFARGKCSLSDGNLKHAIKHGDYKQNSNILFPSYVKNFYKIELTDYSSEYIEKFVAENCNLPKEYPYQIKFSSLLNYNGPYTY